MLWLFRCLLYLYPTAYRFEYGDEMSCVFRDAQSETWGKGILRQGLFFFREVAGLLCGALQERSRTFNRLHLFPSRRFPVRSGFRFPKATPVLMTVILGGVILTIEKATAIRASLPETNPQLPPIQPGHFTFFPALAVIFFAAYAAAAIGWGLLFALRRSGVHRLSGMPAAPARK
jgi:hypothetical protein